MPDIHAIYRYPIKGLSPELLLRAALTPRETIPGDRLYAIENGPSGFDPASPAYLSKTHFLMLMKNERLATLRTSFDQGTHTLTIETLATEQKISAELHTAGGRAVIEHFFANYCAGELCGAPRVLHADGHSFSDLARKVVSIINLASVAGVEDMVGAPVNPLRFRGNLYVSDWPAWYELDLVGKELGIGRQARLKVVKRIARCAATNVDPDTGLRDLEVPQALIRHLGHGDCGIYAEVIKSGEIARGDNIEVT
jgi:uncharacterized protein YcbX